MLPVKSRDSSSSCHSALWLKLAPLPRSQMRRKTQWRPRLTSQSPKVNKTAIWAWASILAWRWSAEWLRSSKESCSSNRCLSSPSQIIQTTPTCWTHTKTSQSAATRLLQRIKRPHMINLDRQVSSSIKARRCSSPRRGNCNWRTMN